MGYEILDVSDLVMFGNVLLNLSKVKLCNVVNNEMLEGYMGWCKIWKDVSMQLRGWEMS